MNGNGKLNIRPHDSWVQALPDLPQAEWCDFRQDYESGLTLKAIGEKYFCDPRTVRRCILQNLGSADIGKQTAAKKLDPYLPRIQHMWEEIAGENEHAGIVSISQKIHEEIMHMGYAGCERTVRNYLKDLKNQKSEQ